MIVTYNWLKEILDTELSPQEISEILTSTGLEVEEFEKIESIKGGLEGVLVGKVVECSKHPDADKLSITKVDLGTETVQIVCGAPNVAEGQKVLVATNGCMLYTANGESFKIKKTKIRGTESNGMICAEDELGLGTSHDGIIVLDEKWSQGTLASEIYKPEVDYTYSLNITPNRNDAMAVLGVAQDIYAYQKVNNKKVDWIYKEAEILAAEIKMPIQVTVKNEDACKRYAGIVLSNVVVEESPEWLKKKLKNVGIKSINNIVDTTNYVMWLLGQPLHAFDYDKIKDHHVIVQTKDWTETFLALDKSEKKITNTDLMICDTEKPMCIAGIYGGAESGISSETKNIFLESAMFDAKYIRKTSQRLGLRTDASQRYEKGSDPNIILSALWKAVQALKEMQSDIKIASEVIDIYPQKIENKTIVVRYERIKEVIGNDIPKETIHKILDGLNIKTSDHKDENFIASIPTNKSDVLREIDVIEEIIRIYGLDTIHISNQVKSNLSLQARPDEEKIYRKLSENLVGLGFREIVTNSLCRSKDASLFYDESNFISLLASINKELDILRPDMILNALPSLSYNIKNGNSNIKFFEKGKAYFKSNNQNVEQTQMVLFTSGTIHEENHHLKSLNANQYYLKNISKNILSQISNSKVEESTMDNHPLLQNTSVLMVNKTVLVTIGELKKNVLKTFDIKKTSYVAMFEWEQILSMSQSQKVVYKEIAKYPIVRRDLSMIMDEKIQYTHIAKEVKKLQIPILKDMDVFDVYQDKKSNENKKSYSMSFYFQDPNKTLVDQEIENAMTKILSCLEEKLSLELRK